MLKGDEAMSIMMMMMILMDLFVTFTFFFSAVCSTDWWNCCAWIGATYVAEERTFIWTSDNSTVGFVNWYPGEPSYSKGADCVTICRNEHLNDHICNVNYPYICQTAVL